MTVSPEKQKAPRKKQKAEPVGFSCEHCKKTYVRESTLLSHVCEPKRRLMEKDQKHVVFAFWAYNHFWKMNMYGAKERTYKDFMTSNVYTAYVRFGRYIMDINAINPKAYVDYLMKNKVKIDDWVKDSVYERYIRELNTKESADAAIQRTTMLMEEWAINTGKPWVDFFREINPNQATSWILSGRISPWVIYTANSSHEMFDRMSDEQLALVHNYINPDFWKHRIKMHQTDVATIREIFDSVGI
jgi:hypothetical protein